MISYSGPASSSPGMHSHTVGSWEDSPSGTYGVGPAPGAPRPPYPEKQHTVPFGSAQSVPASVDALDLSMSPPFMQRMLSSSAQGPMDSPKPLAQNVPQSLDGKRRRTSAAGNPLVSPPTHANDRELPHMDGTVRVAIPPVLTPVYASLSPRDHATPPDATQCGVLLRSEHALDEHA